MQIRKLPIAQPFFPKVDVKKIKDYGDFVKEPKSLGELSTKLQRNKYDSWKEYQADIRKIRANAEAYNDAEHGGEFKNPDLVKTARLLVGLVDLRIAMYATEIIQAQKKSDPELVKLRKDYHDQLPWVQCSKCQKRRLIDQQEHEDLQTSHTLEQWVCEDRKGERGGTCDEPDDEEQFRLIATAM